MKIIISNIIDIEFKSKLLRSKNNRTNMIIPVIMVSLAYLVFTFAGLYPSSTVDFGFAQTPNHDSIQITNTSTHVDESGNFHIVGEVNNTSLYPQSGVLITAVLSDSAKNVVGNFSASSSLDVIRPGELSPFDIVADDPDIVGKINLIEISTSSRFGVEKPANLIINGTSTFLDDDGNPHITGNIVNQGHPPESFLKLVGTFYDNSSHGVVGTQTYGLNVGNLAQNQKVAFDVTVTGDKTKSQGAFFSLNVESNQSSMVFPVNSKTSFVSAGGNNFAGSPPLSGNPVGAAANNNDEQTGDNDDGESRNNGNDDNDDGESRNNGNDDNDDDNDDGDNQRGEKKTDDNGNPWYDDNNCSEEPGSSGGDSSECEDAEREEQEEKEGEDPLEKEQNSQSDSGSTNDNGENDNENDGGNGDGDADDNGGNGDGDADDNGGNGDGDADDNGGNGDNGNDNGSN